MSNKFVFHKEADGRIFIFAAQRGNALMELEPKVYSVNFQEKLGLFLKAEESFKLPEKVYGKVNTNVDRFFRSYELNPDKNLGVMLDGTSGAGKTLTLKAVASKANAMGYPVILVNQRFGGQSFIDFLNSIEQNCIVIFDEFDKVYVKRMDDGDTAASEEQNTILTLLDGASTGPKKMYLFSVNNTGDISQYLFSRPSRIRYHLHFNMIELSTVVEYVSQNLKDNTEEKLRSFVHLARCKLNDSNGMNFDSMRELVQEMNQFGDTVDEAQAIMLPRLEKTTAGFIATVYEPGKDTYTASAMGTFHGSVMGKNGGKITVKLKSESILDEPKPLVTGDEVAEGEDSFTFTRRSVELDDSHFTGFGSEIDIIEFEKDGVRFHMRYVESDELQLKANEMREEEKAMPGFREDSLYGLSRMG